jgi:hypothetical protein
LIFCRLITMQLNNLMLTSPMPCLKLAKHVLRPLASQYHLHSMKPKPNTKWFSKSSLRSRLNMASRFKLNEDKNNSRSQ